MTPLVILRPPISEMNQVAVRKECEMLRSKTKYQKFSKYEEAPEKTDCLTAIKHVFQKSLNLTIDLDYIGNMPRSLSKNGWEVLKVPADKLQTGDLLFLGHKDKLVSHVVLALSQEEIFHNSWEKNGSIENVMNVFAKYRLPEDLESLINYKDHRGSA